MLADFMGVWEEFDTFIEGRNGILHWVIFLAALFACMLMGRRERKLLFWPSLLVMVFFFNPLSYHALGKLFGVYWRLLWMLPISFVIAYALTEGAYKIRRGWIRLLGVALACACLAVTGTRIFTKNSYWEKENAYELPQAVIDVSDYVMARLVDWKETIIVPNEFLCYVRQYSCSVGLLYGRNVGGFITGIGEDEELVYAEMSKTEPDVELITRIAREKNCRYIVFNLAFHQIPEDLTEYGYERAAEVDGGYVIYCRMGEAVASGQ